MTLELITGLALIALPVAFNAAFGLLGARFDYPDVLRRPTAEVLERFRAGGTALVLTWWAFALTAVAFAPVAVLVSTVAAGADPAVLALATTFGVLAAAVQAVGLVRWPFAVPYLARAVEGPDVPAARREAVDVVFQTLNRSLGVGVGEHLGYGLTGLWSLFAGVALIQSDVVPAALGWIGVALAPAFLLGALEFVGPWEERGWRVAGPLVPIAYVAWSLWLLVLGVALIA